MHLRLMWRQQLKQQKQHLKCGASCPTMLGHATCTGDLKIKSVISNITNWQLLFCCSFFLSFFSFCFFYSRKYNVIDLSDDANSDTAPAVGYCAADLEIKVASVEEPDLVVNGSFSLCHKP